jgi:hypothetical protein
MPTKWLQERPNGSKNDLGIGFDGPGVVPRPVSKKSEVLRGRIYIVWAVYARHISRNGTIFPKTCLSIIPNLRLRAWIRRVGDEDRTGQVLKGG